MKIRTVKDLNIRYGKPSTEAPVKGIIYEGFEIEVTGKVEGEALEGNDIWYYEGENYYWSGGAIDQSEIISSKQQNWAIEKFDIKGIWEQGAFGKGIKVAVLDSGIYASHPLLEKALIDKKDFSFSESSGTNDILGHGTHCSGIIGARKAGEVIGVAPEASFFIGKVINDEFGRHYSYLVKAIEWAVDSQVDIISMSVGFDKDYPELYSAIKKAFNSGIILIAAGGNNKKGFTLDDLMYPAKYKECISVGASDYENRLDPISVESDSLDIVAPGTNVFSTDLRENGNFKERSGTSMSAAFVSGVVALGLQKARDNGKSVETASVRKTLNDTATQLNDGTNLKVINPSQFIKSLTEDNQ